MRDIEGNVISGTMSNFFIKRGPFLLTPMLDRCGVAGVMRRWVLEQAGSLGLRPLEGRLRWEEIGEAEEAFVTNAVAGVVPIAVIQQGRDRVAFRHTEISARLHARLELL
jgi:4-amino-4-deoxychorismate lyase